MFRNWNRYELKPHRYIYKINWYNKFTADSKYSSAVFLISTKDRFFYDSSEEISSSRGSSSSSSELSLISGISSYIWRGSSLFFSLFFAIL